MKQAKAPVWATIILNTDWKAQLSIANYLLAHFPGQKIDL